MRGGSIFFPLPLLAFLMFIQSDQSSLCAKLVAKDPRFLHAVSEDSNQTGHMPRLIWVFTGHTFHTGQYLRRIADGNLGLRLDTT